MKKIIKKAGTNGYLSIVWQKVMVAIQKGVGFRKAFTWSAIQTRFGAAYHGRRKEFFKGSRFKWDFTKRL